MSRRLSLLLAALFWAWLCMPMVTGVLGIGRSSAGLEQRTLEAFPELPRDAVALLVYPATVDRYLRDHFGLKRQLVQVLPEIRYRLGLLEGEVRNDILVGREGWLFYAGDKAMQKYAGLACIADARMHKLLDRLEAIRHAAPQAKLVFAIAPDKQGIYPEYLPELTRARTGNCSDYERVMLAARERGFDTPDLRPVLLAAKAAGAQVYHRDDSHWNDAGALAVLQVLLARGGVAFDQAAMPVAQPERISGDLTRLLGLPLLEEAVRVFPAVAATRRPLPLSLTSGDKAFPALQYDYARRGPAVLLLGDSFSAPLARLIGHAGVGRVDWIRLQSHLEAQVLARSRPDVVIVEIVERMLAE